MNDADPGPTTRTQLSPRRITLMVLAIVAIGFVVYQLVDLPTDMAAKSAYRNVEKALDSGVPTTEGEIHKLLNREPDYAGETGRFPFNERYKFVGKRKEHTLNVYYLVIDNATKQLAAVELITEKRP